LPAKWEAPFYYGALKRESRIMRGGMWTARDTKIVDGSGHIVELDADVPAEWGPIGEGRYKRVDFCTNGKFMCFKILGGPRMRRWRTDLACGSETSGVSCTCSMQ
jgi:hypothetical protein